MTSSYVSELVLVVNSNVFLILTISSIRSLSAVTNGRCFCVVFLSVKQMELN